MGKPMDTNQPIFMWTGPGRLANDADIELSGTDPLTGKAMSYIARVKSIGQDDDMGGGEDKSDILTQGPCVYDRGTDTYLLIEPSKPQPVRFHHCYQCFARAISSQKTKTNFWIVSRDGCCSTLGTFYHHETGNPVGEWSIGEPAHMWQSKLNSGNTENPLVIDLNFWKNHPKKYADYKNVTVYQDPIARFHNLCNYWWRAYDKSAYQLCPTIELAKELHASKEKAIWHFIALAEANLYNPPGKWEQHLASHEMHYTEMPILDLIVPLQLLDTYFEKELGMTPVHGNVESKWHITHEDFTEEMLQVISKIYAHDFDIPIQYAPKFYKA